jgi:hypothetical protein
MTGGEPPASFGHPDPACRREGEFARSEIGLRDAEPELDSSSMTQGFAGRSA